MTPVMPAAEAAKSLGCDKKNTFERDQVWRLPWSA
jgi:hypothetical protein